MIHPAPRRGEGGPRGARWEGNGVTVGLSAAAPSTMLRMVPLPRSVSLRGGGEQRQITITLAPTFTRP
jgi:hypothetical protein